MFRGFFLACLGFNEFRGSMLPFYGIKGQKKGLRVGSLLLRR